MVLEQKAAATFVADYKTLMLEVVPMANAKKRPVLEVLSEGRAKRCSDNSLLPAARRRLRARNKLIDVEVYKAVKSMQLKRWIFLRDTRTYSVFIDSSGHRNGPISQSLRMRWPCQRLFTLAGAKLLARLH